MNITSVNNAEIGFAWTDNYENESLILEFWAEAEEEGVIGASSSTVDIEVIVNNTSHIIEKQPISQKDEVAAGDIGVQGRSALDCYRVTLKLSTLKGFTKDKTLLNQSFAFRLALSDATERIWSSPIYKNSVYSPKLEITNTSFDIDNYIHSELTFGDGETDKASKYYYFVDDIKQDTNKISNEDLEKESITVKVVCETQKGYYADVTKTITLNSSSGSANDVTLSIDNIKVENGIVTFNLTYTPKSDQNVTVTSIKVYSGSQEIYTINGIISSEKSWTIDDYTKLAGDEIKYKVIASYSKEGTYYQATQNYPSSTEEVEVVWFDDIQLIDKTGRYSVRYNPEITSFKYNIGESLTPTIGGQYPIYRKNGNQNYRSFSLSGLISYLNFEVEPIARNDSIKITENTEDTYFWGYKNYTQDYYENVIKEREERERVFAFLHNNNFKLFKSAQEGNMIVRLTNISFTPNKQLDRNIYSFAATVTEVAAATPENLEKYGICTISKFVADTAVLKEYYLNGTVDEEGTLTTTLDDGALVIEEKEFLLGGD